MDNEGGFLTVSNIVAAVVTFLLNTGRGLEAMKLGKECLIFLTSKARIQEYHWFYRKINFLMFEAAHKVSNYTSAERYAKELLIIYHASGHTLAEGRLSLVLGNIYYKQNEFKKAREYYQKAADITRSNGDKQVEAECYMVLGKLVDSLCEYHKAEEYYKKALTITVSNGDRDSEATIYENLGKTVQSLGEYDRAEEYYKKALLIRKEIGDREGEAAYYGNLGTLFQSLGEYKKSQEYTEKALAIRKEIGDRKGEAADYRKLGTLFRSRGAHKESQEYTERALLITKEIGDKAGEEVACVNLGNLFCLLGENKKSQEYTERALLISKEIGDKVGEGVAYVNLGNLFHLLGEYKKSQEYSEKALKDSKEIGNRAGEAAAYGNLGKLFDSLGEYKKSQECTEKALAIEKEIGDRKGEAAAYGNLGTLFFSLGEYKKSQEYIEKALAIRKEIGDREGEAADYGNLATLFGSLGEYKKSQEYAEKALKIRKEIGDRAGEAAAYGNLGSLFYSLGEYEKSQEYIEKALGIRKEIGVREGEAANYANLGTLFHSLGELEKAEVYFREALLICKDIGDSMKEFKVFCSLTVLKLAQFNVEETFSYLIQSIAKFEKLRNFLKGNDHFQISLLEEHGASSYEMLSKLLFVSENFTDALYVEELRRARALADLMTSQYSAKEFQFSGDPRSWCGIHDIIKGEASCNCIYLSVGDEDVRIWILQPSGEIRFRRKRMDSDCFENAGSVPNLKALFSQSFRHFAVLPKEVCEDRSLNDERVRTSSDDVNRSPLAHTKGDDMKKNLHLCYETIVTPVADLLKEPEIIIVPDSCMYQVPFAALIDEGGRYLCEEFRIRIAPSLTTLKLIKDSPANYHSQNGALIVGEPEVREVIYRGHLMTLDPLPWARKEAEMIAKMLGVPPLLGRHATKEAVIEQMKSVALIHFAAHGDPERGEIALCPVRTTNDIPQEEEYLLTMADVSKVQLRAKLVVLSCCHSGRGEIKVEGVIGIARAFLGSGARSVLVARWALDDESTEQFMNRFYEHLFRGESASESLHEVRKWMRSNAKYSEVKKWAPFMLIGDNVTLRKEDIVCEGQN